jgi:DivIVA domain-containing protein
MTIADGPPPSARRPVVRMTPARLRATQFPRAAVGRRGYSAEAVDQFLRRMAEEITGRDAAEANLRAQLDRLRRALKQWQSRQLERRETGQLPVVMSEGRTVDAVNTLSQAQQQADAYIAQAQEYCRQITADARNRADAILCEAQERAEATAAQARQTFEQQQHQVKGVRAETTERPALPLPPPPSAAPGIDLDELDRRLTWARSFVAALQSVESQLATSREALGNELDALDRMRRPATGTPALAQLGPGSSSLDRFDRLDR